MKVFCKKSTSLVIQGKTYNLHEGLIDIGNPIHAEMLIAQGLVERVSTTRSSKVSEVVMPERISPEPVVDEGATKGKGVGAKTVAKIEEPPIEEPPPKVNKSGPRKQVKK